MSRDSTSFELGLVGQQVRIGADDRQRCTQLVGDERDQLAACLVDRLERLDPGFGLTLLTTLLDDPRQQVRHRAQLGDIGIAEHARSLGLDVEDADRLVVPAQRHAEHRGHEAALVDAADPQEARVLLDVRDDERSLTRGHRAGHALAEGHPRPADLEPVEAVGRGERQVRSITVEQVERGDVRMEGIAGPVDDRLQQLVPGARGRRQPRHVVDEPQLVELAALATRSRRRGRRPSGPVLHARPSLRHVNHLTRVGTVAQEKGCGAVIPRLRYRPRLGAP